MSRVGRWHGRQLGRRVATGLDVTVAAERPWGMGRHLLDDLVDDLLRGLADDADALLRGLADLAPVEPSPAGERDALLS